MQMCAYYLNEAKKFIIAIINENYNLDDLRHVHLESDNKQVYQDLIDYLL